MSASSTIKLLPPGLTGLFLFLSLLLASPVKTEETLQMFIQQRLERLHFEEQNELGSDTIYAAGLLLDLYRDNQFNVLWKEQGTVDQLLGAIKSAAEEGLIPDDYHLQSITRYGKKLRQENATLADLVNHDILLSDAMLLLAHHKRYGKVDAGEVEEKNNLATTTPRSSLIDACFHAITTGTVRAVLDALSPSHAAYINLRQALATYRKIAGSGGWPQVPPGHNLRPGMVDERVAVLRERLFITGDLAYIDSSDPNFFDQELEEAVRHFQARHHLDADGIVGRATLGAMNVSVSDRIRQIRVNLERTRWVIHDLPSSSLIVDIAGFMLQYYHQDQLVWKTKVMVGQPFHQTPVFRSAVTYMVLNPTWTIPPGIARNETIPNIIADKTYLEKQNLRVLDNSGMEIDPDTIPWWQYQGRNIPYMLRQDAGPDNALGLIKFMFSNPYHVYLHDTPSKYLFGKTQRAFSNGCIRVQNPLQLGKMLLANDPGNPMTEARFDQIIESGRTTTVFLKQPLPIFLMYLTTNVLDGTVLFKPDLYNRDEGIFTALNRKPVPLEQIILIPESKRTPWRPPARATEPEDIDVNAY
ncbi:L,D-transpeptidase family protein [Desulfobulbus alkaliphilus]|uniref:L,D-transpeptidase family protein n=1 Tax=Desulfobulbus alkaliphilus TaxID=869814 RepID=UPI0019630ED0|nr:L,D-transpeptidase family protein [Desulfobulbus alkaliphilus]MBM9538079.1 L,D-transpeptidase family protein [Desulfobulbus alkaliphilus]